jgi:hypothetical protein
MEFGINLRAKQKVAADDGRASVAVANAIATAVIVVLV